jgi:hypothetical protein
LGVALVFEATFTAGSLTVSLGGWTLRRDRRLGASDVVSTAEDFLFGMMADLLENWLKSNFMSQIGRNSEVYAKLAGVEMGP